tara:strand:- start:205 stop:510 length:306 start_codon:yes stop_codon:yes gene_type:complete
MSNKLFYRFEIEDMATENLSNTEIDSLCELCSHLVRKTASINAREASFYTQDMDGIPKNSPQASYKATITRTTCNADVEIYKSLLVRDDKKLESLGSLIAI